MPWQLRMVTAAEHALSVCECMQDAIDSFLRYLYWDKLDPRTSPQHAVAVLHVAHYYGASRLVALCEVILAKEIKKGDRDDEGVSLGNLNC